MANKIYATRNPDITPREIDHMALSRSLAGECVVLLENDGTLPLEGKGKLALFGNGARQTIRGGTGSGDVNTRSDVNIERGLEEAGFTVTTKAWLDRQDAAHAQAKIDHAAWIVEEAKRTNSSEFTIGFSHPFQVIAPIEITKEDLRGAEGDLAVYVISRTAGEGADRWNKRGDYLLYNAELEQLRLLAGLYKKLVLVLNLGGVIDMSEILSVEGINAIVLMGQLGNIGGQVLGDVLTGRHLGEELRRLPLLRQLQPQQRQHRRRILYRRDLCGLPLLRHLRGRAGLSLRLRPVLYDLRDRPRRGPAGRRDRNG